MYKAEQAPEDWWDATCSSTKELLQIPKEDIKGISFCSQCSTVVLVDKDGNALRPAMNIMDTRASKQFTEYFGNGLKVAWKAEFGNRARAHCGKISRDFGDFFPNPSVHPLENCLERAVLKEPVHGRNKFSIARGIESKLTDTSPPILKNRRWFYVCGQRGEPRTGVS